MECRGCSRGQDDGKLCYGCPHGARGGSAKRGRDGIMGRGPLGGGCYSVQVEDVCGPFVDLENTRHSAGLENFGHGLAKRKCYNQDRIVFAQEKDLNSNHEHDDEVLDRLQELEMQVKMIHSENLECENVLLRLYNLVSSSISENRGQKSMLAGKMEHLEASLGLAFSRRAQTREVIVGELEEISRKITKLQKHMEGNGNYVDLSVEKSKKEEPDEAFKNGGQK